MNTVYFANIITIINSANSCSEVSAALAQATTAIAALQAALAEQLTALALLVVAPTNLAELITWSAAVINTYLGPQAAIIAQQTIVATQLADIIAAASARSSALGCV